MTNDEILEIVFNTYKVNSMVKKLIKNSLLDHSCDDLEQIIYLQLLVMDNNKLNHLYLSNNLKKWINQIIKNQRNYYKNDYQRSRVLEHSEPTDEMLLTFDHNYMLDWLDEELNKYDWNNLNSKEEINMCANYEILKFYLSSGYSMSKISKLFNCSATKINQMILTAKNNIKTSYDRNYDNWIDDIAFKFMGNPIE